MASMATASVRLPTANAIAAAPTRTSTSVLAIWPTSSCQRDLAPRSSMTFLPNRAHRATPSL
jgi:hypothetical protein